MDPARRSPTFSRRQLLRTATILPAAMALLQACGGAPATNAPSTQSAGAPPAASHKPQELTHWVYSSLPLDKTTLKSVPSTQKDNVIEYFDWNVAEYKKVEPATTVKLQYLPHDQNWFAKLDAALVAGTPPDVVQGPVSEAAKYIPLGALSPIDGYMTQDDKADIVKSVADESNFGGKNYIWPWRLSFGGGIQINATLWKQHGAGNLLPTGDTRQWLMDDCLKAFQATTVGDQLYGTVLVTDIHYQITQFMFGFGARLFNEDETAVILNSPEGVAGLEWLLDLENKYKVAIPGTAVRKAAEGSQLFLQRKAASYPSQGSGLQPAELNGVQDFEWYWVPPPNVPGKKPAVMTNVHGHYVFKQKDADRTDAANRYTQYLVRPDALALSLAQFGMPPARQSLWKNVTDENQKVGLHFTDLMITFGRRASAAPITFTEVPRMLEAAFSKQKTAKQALDDLATTCNKLIQDAIAQEKKQ
jgi:multiple sugar transport system substrate-binding protein